MCFFTEAQQRAFDAIQQRRAAQASGHPTVMPGFNPFGTSVSPAAASPAPASATPLMHAQAAPHLSETAAATVAKAFAQSDPELVTRFIQEVVAHQLQQAQVQQQQQQQQTTFNFSPAAYATPMQCGVEGVKRQMDEFDEVDGEPAMKRSKIEPDAMSETGDRASKKRRFVWTPELRDIFDRAVSTLEPELVGPKNIYGMMLRLAPAVIRDSDLNTQHIKSHLQKWRIAKRRNSDDGTPEKLTPSAMPPTSNPPSMPSTFRAPPPPPSTVAPMSMPPMQPAALAPPAGVQSFASIPTPACTMATMPSVNVSPESREMREMPVVPVPGMTFLAPPVPPPKATTSDLDAPLLYEGIEDSGEPLISSWDSLFTEGPAKDDMNSTPIMSAIPSDVLSELSKASDGSDGLSSTDILRYMMLGYQLGYQNCGFGDGSSDAAATANPSCATPPSAHNMGFDGVAMGMF